MAVVDATQSESSSSDDEAEKPACEDAKLRFEDLPEVIRPVYKKDIAPTIMACVSTLDNPWILGYTAPNVVSFGDVLHDAVRAECEDLKQPPMELTRSDILWRYVIF